MRLPELDADQLKLLAACYEGFRQAGKWPTMSYVDVALDRGYGLDVEPILYGLPPGLERHGPNFQTEQATIELTVAGMHRVEAAQSDLRRFVALVRACADRERGGRPGPTEVGRYSISSADACAIWPEPTARDDAARVFAIFQVEGLHAGSSGPDDEGNWTMSIDRNMRRYRDIANVEDYLARRPEPPAARWSPPPAVEPYVFILMPFGEVWSTNVNDAISQACAEVATNFAGLRAERADDITEPGRITDQIVSAIERADVLIADITGSNANVLFELGYGDALRKPTIVLNQVVEQTPFDIRDWRQIIYSTESLAMLRETLAKFLIGTLLRQGFSRTTL